MKSATARSVPTSWAAAEHASHSRPVSRPNRLGRRVRPAPPGSVAAGPAWADGGPGRLPSGEAMPVESRSAQPVAEAQHYGGTCHDAETSKQRGEDRDTRAGRGSLWLPGTVQPDPYRGSGWRVADGRGGHGGEDAGPFGSVGQPPPCDRGNGDSRDRPGLGQCRHDRPQACRRHTFGLVEVPGEAHRCHGSGEEDRCQGQDRSPLGTVSRPAQIVAAENRRPRRRSGRLARLAEPLMTITSRQVPVHCVRHRLKRGWRL